MRCGWRFGKSVLRARLGCRHLTEGHPAGPGRERGPGAAASDDPGCDEREAEAGEEDEQKSSRTAFRVSALQRRSGHRSDRRTPVLDEARRRSRGTDGDGSRSCARRRARRDWPPPGRWSRASCARHVPDANELGRRCLCRSGRSNSTPTRPLTSRPPRTIRRATGLRHRRSCTDRLRRGRGRLCRWLRRPGLRLTLGPRREERKWIEVAVRVRSQANPEMDIGLSPFGLAARADGARDLAFLDRRPGAHTDRAEVHEGDRVAVGGANRQAEPLVRQLARERDHAGGRSPDLGGGRRRDVDPAVLSGGIRVVLGDERAQNSAVDRPRPARRGWARNEREQNADRQGGSSVAQVDNHASTQ
jgi:hypothetical protein